MKDKSDAASDIRQALKDLKEKDYSSVSWMEQELTEKHELLEAFWNKNINIVNPKKENIDKFKKGLIWGHYPKEEVWEARINEVFSCGNFDEFFDVLKECSLQRIRAFIGFDETITVRSLETQEDIHDIRRDVEHIRRYMVDKHMSASISLGYAESALVTPTFPENYSSYAFSMLSVGKIFTGILAMRMIRSGFITEKELTTPPVQLDPSIHSMLSSEMKERLDKVSLHQLMCHEAGLGDYNEKYFQAINDHTVPEMKEVEEFLQFTDNEFYPIGEFHYSNTGMLIVGLAIQHAYEKKHGPCSYNEILQTCLIDQIGMSSFSPFKPESAKVNPNSDFAPCLVGSPAGCYWSTAEDLAKFGQWLYKQCTSDHEFKALIEKYGQEFYNAETQIVSHAGDIDSACAFLSVSLKTGAVVATLSAQPDMARDLEFKVQDNIFFKSSSLADEHEVRLGF